MYAKDWLKNAHEIMSTIEETQLENIRKKRAVGCTLGAAVTPLFLAKKCILASVVS